MCCGFVAGVPSVQDEVTRVGVATTESEVVVGRVGSCVEEVGDVADELGVGQGVGSICGSE